MAVRMGEMMVVVRAQDFASRTLHKVSGELAGMSKQQALAARGADLSARRRDLQLLERQLATYKQLSSMQMRHPALAGPTPGWAKGVTPAMIQQHAALSAEMAHLNTEVTKLSPEMQRLALSEQRLGEASRKLTADQTALGVATKRLSIERLHAFAQSLGGIGRTMQLFGAVGLAVFGGAAAYFGKFNEQATLAATQTVSIGQGFSAIVPHAKALQEAIYNLMRQFPASGEEMAKSAYDIYSSMQVTFGGGIRLLKLFNQLAVATGTDLQTATNAGITALNNFGNRGTSVQRIIQLMTTTVHYGRMRLSDFNDMLNKVAPAAANAGMNLKDVAGAMALITTRQPSQQMSATGIARLIQVFQDPDFQQGIQTASNGMVDIRKAGGGLKPLPTIINDIAGAFKQVATQKGAAQLFRELTAVGRGSGRGTQSTIFAQRAWTFLFKNLRDYNILQQKVTGDTKDFARSLKVMSESPGVRMQVLVNQLRLLGLEIGEAAIPYVLKLGDYIQRLVHWIKELSPHTKGLIAKFVVFAAGASLLAGVLLGVAGPLIAIYAGLKKMGIGLAAGETGAIRIAAVLKTLPFIGLGILVTQIFGVVKGLKIMALAWVAWKAIAVAQAGIVATANIAAATATGTAWETAAVVMRQAMLKTFVGAVAVAAGIALEYMISHWNQTKAAFLAVMAVIGTGWQNLMKLIVGASAVAFSQIGTWLDKLSDSWFGWISGLKLSTSFVKVLGHAMGESTKDLGAQGRALIKASGFWKFYHQNLKKAGDANKKKDPMGGLFSNKFWKDLIKQSQDYSGTLDNLYNNVSKKESDLAKARRSAMRDALQQLESEKKTALQTMSTTYAALHAQNEQAMGTIFGGPTMQGILGNVFSSINDTLRQFGIQIPVPFQILRQDMDQQMTYFKRWRGDLDKLVGRGIPKRMILEIAKLGPSAIPMIEGLLGASPKQLRKYVSDYKSMQKQIDAASEQDFNRQLAVWREHGKKAMWAILQGADEVSAPLQDKWRKYINRTFGSVLKAELKRLYAAALKIALQTMPPTPGAGPGKGPGKGGGPGTTTTGGTRGGRNLTELQRATKQLRIARMHSQAYYDWATNPDSPGGRRFTRAEMAHYRQLSTAEYAIQQHINRIRSTRRQAAARRAELRSIAQQLEAHARSVGPHRGVRMVTITYGGDHVTVKADGATPASVMKAFNRHKFRRRKQTHGY